MSEENAPIKRKLFSWEIQEARRVFGNSIDYERVWIHELSRIPVWLDRAARLLRRGPAANQPNAVSIGDHCYFPERLPRRIFGSDTPERFKIAWLIHELTHVWQYQRIGWVYLIKALHLQLWEGINAYYFGGGAGLEMAIKCGKRLSDFNLEQQGEISRSYYNRLVRGFDVGAWQPFIDEIKKV